MQKKMVMVLKFKINDKQSYSKLIKTFNRGLKYSMAPLLMT